MTCIDKVMQHERLIRTSSRLTETVVQYECLRQKHGPLIAFPFWNIFGFWMMFDHECGGTFGDLINEWFHSCWILIPQRGNKSSNPAMDTDLDHFDDEIELQDFDRLPCSWNYVVVCIFMPALTGQLNALLFPAYTLHFEEMGWPLLHAGMAVTIGFVSRVLVQQMMLRAGYWLAVPLCCLHLTWAILAVLYTTSEWAVFAQIVAVFSIDPACAIEGIAFDAFGASEVQARQATSTSLSVWTINQALSCTIGGLIYDSFGWFGIATYHSACEGLLLFLLCLQPACRKSFVEVIYKRSGNIGTAGIERESGHEDKVFTHVLPGAVGMQLPGATENLQLEDVEEGFEDLDEKHNEDCVMLADRFSWNCMLNSSWKVIYNKMAIVKRRRFFSRHSV